MCAWDSPTGEDDGSFGIAEENPLPDEVRIMYTFDWLVCVPPVYFCGTNWYFALVIIMTYELTSTVAYIGRWQAVVSGKQLWPLDALKDSNGQYQMAINQE